MRSDRYKAKRKKWKIIKWILVIVLAIVFCYAFLVYASLQKALKDIHDPLDRQASDLRKEEIELSGDPFSVLLLGVDERKGDVGRSDTMVVLTVNPKKKNILMLSIPRDTRVDIVGKKKQDKINHAYAYGGVDMSVKTVENFLNIPIDYYIKVNMEGFSEIVDSVGGITVNNERAFTYAKQSFPVGEVEMNGKKALAYVRMRKGDPKGDLGRQQRQRLVIAGILKKGASLSSLTRFDDIFNALGENVNSNLTFKEMVAIQQHYRKAAANIEQLQIKVTNTRLNGIYYGIVNETAKQQIQTRLQDHLNYTP